MNNLFPCVVSLAALTVLSSCATNQNAAGHAATAQTKSTLPVACVKPYFRINMGVGYGPLAPTSVPPVSPDVIWQDVAIWQTFLNTHTPYHCLPVDDAFKSNPEMNATVQFQASRIGGAPVPQTGRVDRPTFLKAMAAGLPNYCTIDTVVNEATHRRHGHVKHRAKPAPN